MQKRLASRGHVFHKNNVYIILLLFMNISPRKPKPCEGLLNIYTLTCYNKSIINSNQKVKNIERPTLNFDVLINRG